MQIEAVQTQLPNYPPEANLSPDNAQVEEPEQNTSEEPQQTDDVQPASSEQPDNTEKAKGVIRLLLEGHFKGVADVRLRINFHDQLSAMQTTQTKQTVEDNIDNVTESVGPLLETDQITPETAATLLEDFTQAVNQAKQDFLAAENPSTHVLFDSMNSAFAQLIALLNEQLSQTTEQIPPEESPEADDSQPTEVETTDTESQEPTSEPSAEQDDLQPTATPDLVTSLQSAFDAAMNQLAAALDGSAILPPLSPPSGNGKAYAKFLAIYNELYGIEPAAEQVTTDETIELVA